MLDGDTDTAYLRLGDGIQGRGLPGETLNVAYIRTAGATGNCGAGVITYVPDDLDELITIPPGEFLTEGVLLGQEASFVTFSGKGGKGAGRDTVHAVEVAELIGLGNGLDILHQVTGTQHAQGFVLGTGRTRP